jgi:hypothetical protein
VGGGDDWEPEVASFAVESRGAALMLDPLASSPAARGPAPSTTGAGSARRRCTCGAPDPSAADAPTDGRTSSGAFAVVARRVTGSPTRPRHAIVRRTSTDPQRSPAAQGTSPRHLSRRVHMYAATLLHDPRRNGRGRGSAPPSGRARLEGTAGGHRARRRDRRDAGRCDLAGRRPRDRRPHEHLPVLAQGSSEMASPARCLSSNCQRSLSSPRDRVREEFRACRSGTRLFSGAREIAETAGEERLERLVTACRG